MNVYTPECGNAHVHYGHWIQHPQPDHKPPIPGHYCYGVPW